MLTAPIKKPTMTGVAAKTGLISLLSFVLGMIFSAMHASLTSFSSFRRMEETLAIHNSIHSSVTSDASWKGGSPGSQGQTSTPVTPVNADDTKLHGPSDPLLYGRLCNATIIGEKEPWNQHKKVIAFSIFAPTQNEPLPEWVQQGIEIQIETAKLFYPDWILRFYAVGIATDLIHALVQHDRVEVVRCADLAANDASLLARNMLQRFLVVDDPTVRIALVRDVDCRFSIRELLAVNEFLSSPYLFHSMRDHKWHTIPVMGGVFGMKRGLLDQTNTTMLQVMEDALTKYPHKIPGCCASDQNILTMFIWPKVKQTTLSHDMDQMRCRRYGAAECRDFPIGPRNEDENYFIGAPFKPPDRTPRDNHKCTLKCWVEN